MYEIAKVRQVQANFAGRHQRHLIGEHFMGPLKLRLGEVANDLRTQQQ